MQLLIVDADLLLTPNFTQPAAITKKTLHSRTTSYRACSEINVIQPKCWCDKLDVKLSFYVLSVFTDDIFDIFNLPTKSNARANVVAAKQQHFIQCDYPMIWKRLIQCPKCTQSKIQQENKPTSQCVHEKYFFRLWTLRQKATWEGKFIVIMTRAWTNNSTNAKYNLVESGWLRFIITQSKKKNR